MLCKTLALSPYDFMRVGAGYDIEAVEFYLNRGDVQSAMVKHRKRRKFADVMCLQVVAKMSDERSDLIPRLKSLESAEYSQVESNHLSPRCRERTATEVDSSKDMIQRVRCIASDNIPCLS